MKTRIKTLEKYGLPEIQRLMYEDSSRKIIPIEEALIYVKNGIDRLEWNILEHGHTEVSRENLKSLNKLKDSYLKKLGLRS